LAVYEFFQTLESTANLVRETAVVEFLALRVAVAVGLAYCVLLLVEIPQVFFQETLLLRELADLDQILCVDKGLAEAHRV